MYVVFILLKYHENHLGDTDVDRQTSILIINLIVNIITCTGIFQEIENSQNLERIEYSPDWTEDRYIMYEGKSKLYFTNSLYFVVVTMITVGYGDINPNSNLGMCIAIVMLLITLVVVP
jgi:hypothetical protein